MKNGDMFHCNYTKEDCCRICLKWVDGLGFTICECLELRGI